MAREVQQCCVLSPLLDLATIKDTSEASHRLVGGRDALPVSQTPTSSDPTSERADPVTLLSLPVEGFHHPRQHVFTDKLVGRFYADSSLDAETRKTSKCLAGRLGTACGNTARPRTTAGSLAAVPPFRHVRSPAGTGRGKCIHASASTPTLGTVTWGRAVRQQPRGAKGRGLSGKKEQVQKEIQEQKALIEKLEGRMASLSGYGGRVADGCHKTGATAERGSTAPRQDEGDADHDDVDRRPATMPGPGHVGQERGGDYVDEEYDSAAEKRSPNQGRKDSHRRRRSRGGTSNSEGTGGGHDSPCTAELQRETSATCIQAAERGRVARRALDLTATCQPHSPPQRADAHQKDASAVKIQQTARQSGSRKKFLKLQRAREEFEHHLLAVVSLAETSPQETQRKPGSGVGSQKSSSARSSVQSVSDAATRTLEISRKNGLAKPPFKILREMYVRSEAVAEALASLAAAMGDDHVPEADGSSRALHAAMEESFCGAKTALDVMRSALGADIEVGERLLAGPVSPVGVLPTPLCSAAGSGRAAVVAMTSARGGLLVSPCNASCREAFTDSCGEENNTRTKEGRIDPGERSPPQTVSLSTLGVEGVGLLLRGNGFGEHVADFVAQAVDGMMLSDPNLCEADLAELGLGGEEAGTDAHRARLVSFFRQCQERGVLSAVAGSLQPSDEAIGPEPDATGARGSKSTRLGEGTSCIDRGESGASRDAGETRDGTSVVGDHERRVATSESPSHQNPVVGNPVRQRVLSDVALDVNKDTANAAGGVARRMSVTLNLGVLMTFNDRDAELLDNQDELSPFGIDVEEAKQGRVDVPLPATGTARAQGPKRRNSMGVPKISLERECDGNDELRSSDAGDLNLPPAVAIGTGHDTLNVFR